MKGYLLSLTGAIILSAVVSILVSDGKMGRFIKGMTRLFVFSIVIVPLVSLFGEKKFLFPRTEISSDSGYLEQCAAMLERADEEAIEAFLREEYSLSAEAEMTRERTEGFAREKISVKISGDGIFEPGTHIDMMSEIEMVLEKNYGCAAEVTWLGRESESS